VAHGNFFFENRWMRAVAHVDYRIILNVRPIPDANVMNITANCAVTPDRSLFAKVHVADYLGTGFNICGGVNLRVNTAKWSDHDFNLLVMQIVTYAKLAP
jgi:hypothetical protein